MDGLGRTLLFVAVVHQQEHIVRRLLAEDGLRTMDINKVAASGNTALHVAAREGRADLVQVLLEHGADPSVRNAESGDATALDMAKMMGHDKVATILQCLE